MMSFFYFVMGVTVAAIFTAFRPKMEAVPKGTGSVLSVTAQECVCFLSAHSEQVKRFLSHPIYHQS